jgi:glycosyltransferase involved in cell wall biosynthesis
MVVAEAMCYRMPIIVSNHVGAGEHLVLDGENGHKFTAGSVDELSAVMQKLADDSIERRKEMGDRSLRLISEWNERDVASHMDEYIAAVSGD